MAAWIIGFSGAFLSYGVGSRALGLSFGDVAICILAVNLAGLIGGLIVLQVEKIAWVRAHLLTRSLKTWAFLISLYVGIQLVIAPPLRDLKAFLWLSIPLLMSTGLMINPIMGPSQDWLVRRNQRRARSTS